MLEVSDMFWEGAGYLAGRILSSRREPLSFLCTDAFGTGIPIANTPTYPRLELISGWKSSRKTSGETRFSS
jgi:hypothetical protein